MKFTPLYDRVSVVPQDPDDVKGGIIIPDTAKEKPVVGKVIRVGKGRMQEDGSFQKLLVRPGDIVLFGKYSGTEVIVGRDMKTLKDIKRVILREDELLGLAEEGEDEE